MTRAVYACMACGDRRAISMPDGTDRFGEMGDIRHAHCRHCRTDMTHLFLPEGAQ